MYIFAIDLCCGGLFVRQRRRGIPRSGSADLAGIYEKEFFLPILNGRRAIFYKGGYPRSIGKVVLTRVLGGNANKKKMPKERKRRSNTIVFTIDDET